MERFDFGGWATKNDLKCSDGRTIRRDAFKHNDGCTVPLVWNHQHDDPKNVLGHALLRNRKDGVYTYCTFNDTESGRNAKMLVEHGDVVSLSIFANQLKQNGADVLHGMIREVSLVLAGANPGAFIDSVAIAHSDGAEEEAIIWTGEGISLFHDGITNEPEEEEPVAKTDEKTVQDVIDSMNEDQKNVMYYMVGEALKEAGVNVDDEDNEETEEDTKVKHNAFDRETKTENVLSHSDMQAIFKEAKRCGSLREAFLAHADDMELAHSTSTETSSGEQTYGVIGADNWLFPEARVMNNGAPEFIKRKMEWVSVVMHGVHHTPFSRIKSLFADITADDARARGYLKGNMKKEEFFTLLKRTTTPTTIYKKQKMDRDDVTDITDFDVVAWLKSEMRMMLDEEIARAILVGDGRLSSSDDKINEMNIRPIWTDEDLYTIKTKVTVASGATDNEKCKALIKGIVKSRKEYRGSGEPTMFTTEDVLTDLLLMEDNNGRFIYDTIDKLKSVLRVKNIVTVPVMEGLSNDNGELKALIVNLKDYNVGADKGGAVNMFDDFDIDYNQQKYLIETRCSGALIKPYSAIAVSMAAAA